MYEYKAKVTRIIDGDTYEVDVSLGFGVTFTTKLRLNDLDTPETWRPKSEGERVHGEAATSFVTELMLNRTVTIRTSKQGKYGRYVADVTLPNGDDLRSLLVENNFEKRDEYL